jgi:hypothetical protein
MAFEIRACPYCNKPCDADWVDVGVGWIQCGPFHCEFCRASEIGPHDEPRPLSADEERTGWYAPDSEPGSSANVIDGQVVSAEMARFAYRREFTNNPLWTDKSYVADWWARTRTGDGE